MTEPFSNTSIDLAELPELESVEYEGLEKNSLKIDLIGSAIFLSFPLFAYLVFFIINPEGVALWKRFIPLGVLLLVIASIILFQIKAFPKKAYAVRNHDITYKRGLWWQINTVIPFSRIQHCEVKQGPFQKMYNLASLKVYTAGGQASDMTIPGLLPDRAEQLKHLVLNRINADEHGLVKLGEEE